MMQGEGREGGRGGEREEGGVWVQQQTLEQSQGFLNYRNMICHKIQCVYAGKVCLQSAFGVLYMI